MESLTLSPIGLFLQAGPVGKAVMAVLALASVWSLALIVEGVYMALALGRALRRARAGDETPRVAPIFAEGERAAGVVIAGESVGERRRRIGETMARAARETLTRAEGGLPNLAVVASVAPFIGLFGTVWGIMSSFAGIAAAKDTSLAVVAPGIAEALAATAYGLAAAIPAVVGYNRIGAAFSRLGRGFNGLVEERAVAIVARAPTEAP